MRRFLVLMCTVLTLAGCNDEPAGPEDVDFWQWPGVRQLQTARLPTGDIIRYTLYLPPALDMAGPPVPLVVAAHYGGEVTPGLGGAYADLLVARAFESFPAIIVAPDAASASGWSAADEASIVWLVGHLRATYPIDPRRIVMTGYSAGGAQTWLVANRNQDLFTAAIPMSARPRATEYPWRIPVFVIHSRDDGLIPLSAVEEYVAAQQAAGAPVRLHLVSDMSHYQTGLFVPALTEAVTWLQGVWR